MDKIEIIGIVEIRNGKNHVIAKNHITDAMMEEIISWLACISVPTGGTSGPTHSWHIYIGEDTTTSSDHSMTQLVQPIGTAPGTAPNSKSGATRNPDAGVYRVVYSATWDAGTVSGTLGEMALYLDVVSGLQGFGAGWPSSASERMVSRLASADGDFTSFTIDDTVPLTVTWTLQMSST